MDTSEHCKEVYANFGLAMYLAQCVEQSITQLIIFFDFFEENADKWESHEKWRADIDEFEGKLSKATMGRLINRLKTLKNFAQLDNGLEALLFSALERRNWLAHRYFFDRGTHFIHEEGRDEMISELEESQELFKKVEEKLNPITHEVSAKYGLTEIVLNDIVEKLKEVGSPDISEEKFYEIIKYVRKNL